MPFYDYYCSDCQSEFQTFHLMSEECENCQICKSNNIAKIVSTLGQKAKESDFRKKIGDVVKSHIEDAKKDIKQEKKRMKTEVFKDD